MENTTLHFAWAQPLAADLAAARSRIVCTALSLQPPRNPTQSNLCALWDSLQTAIANGARVTFLLPAPSASHPATRMNNTAAAALQTIGARFVMLSPVHLLHAKTVAIDDTIAWIGSGNWTAAAATHNHEAYIRTTAPQLAYQLAAHWRDTIQPRP